MTLAPEENRGIYYSRQNRRSRAWQVGATVSKFVSNRSGEHLLKIGADLMQSRLDGDLHVRPINIVRVDGTRTRRQVAAPATGLYDATDVAAFLQDRWHVSNHLLLEYGLRVERDGVFGRVNVTPRAGAAIAIDSERHATVRGGWGYFYERTPLMAGAFPQLPDRTEISYGADGQAPIGPPVVSAHRLGDDLRTSRSATWNVGYEHRLRPWLAVRANFLQREGRRELILDTAQDGTRGVITLASTGRSSYRDAEAGAHFKRGTTLEADVSYTWSRSRADLNDAFGYFLSLTANPILRPNAYGPTDRDAPHRFVGRGRASVGRNWVFELAGEARTGFPYSAVNEELDFVGERNGLRFPTVWTVDASVERRLRVGRFEPWIGLVFVNALNTFNPVDVQRNVASPAFGYFYSSPIRQVRITVHFHP
jgi:hypothetical protein